MVGFWQVYKQSKTGSVCPVRVAFAGSVLGGDVLTVGNLGAAFFSSPHLLTRKREGKSNHVGKLFS